MKGEPRLLCKKGHPVEKFKKLKAWQGHLHGKECDICRNALEREEQRWRCNNHCHWNVCQTCYEAHWAWVIQKASRMNDDKQRARWLNAVPYERRAYADYVAASEYTKVLPREWRNEHQAANSEASNGSLRGANLGDTTLCACEGERGSTGEVMLWLGVGSFAAWLANIAGSAVLRNEELGFPHPWLLVGLANLCTCLLCHLAAWVLNHSPAGGVDASEWKAASILGLMYGAELGLGAMVLYHLPLALRDEAYAFMPLIMFAGGILAGTETKPMPPGAGVPGRPLQEQIALWRLLLRVGGSVGCVTLGGMMMGGSSPDWELVSMFPLAFLAGIIAMFRWIFTRNVLPHEGGIPVVAFAGRLVASTAALGFEITFITDFSAYRGLLSLPHPGQVVGLVVVTALGSSVSLVSALHLTQITSVTVIGFMQPLFSVVLLSFAVIFGVGPDLTVLNGLGAVLCLNAMLCYSCLRQTEPADADVMSHASSGYHRMEAGGRYLNV